MAEYIERKALLRMETFMLDEDGFESFCVLSADIRRFPAADVVDVVRCKDCKWYDVTHLACIYPHHNGWCGIDHFCGYGERREENET